MDSRRTRDEEIRSDTASEFESDTESGICRFLSKSANIYDGRFDNEVLLDEIMNKPIIAV